MAAVLKRFANTYDYLFNDLTHPMTKDWLLVSSPIPLLAILIGYNVFCTKIGPMMMKNKPPYKLDTLLILYNLSQVMLNSCIFYEGYVYLFSGNYNFNCEGFDDMVDKSERVPRGFQLYFMVKLIELLDTVFFVLRKSDRQITFLHLYHHTVMPFAAWLCLKYFPGGQSAIVGTINSLVHVYMYGYYLLSALGPQFKKYLWWKQYLTMMQIGQFFICTIHSFHTLFHSCSYSHALKMLTVMQGVSFIYMFSEFYYQSYIINARLKRTVTVKVKNQVQCDSNAHSVDELKVNDEKDVTGHSIANGSSCEKYSNGKANERNDIETRNGKCKDV